MYVSGSPEQPVLVKCAPPSSVVKRLRGVFVWVFGVLFLLCFCVSVSGMLFSVGVRVCVTCGYFYIYACMYVSGSPEQLLVARQNGEQPWLTNERNKEVAR